MADSTVTFFTIWIGPFAEWNRYMYSQASSNYREYLRVLK